MRRSWRLALGALGVAALTLSLILSGCGATPTTTAGQGTAQLAAASTATAVASAATVAAAFNAATMTAVSSAAIPTTPLPPPDPASLETAGCPTLIGGPFTPQYTTVDGLKVSISQRWTTLDHPSEQMPSNLPQRSVQGSVDRE